MFVACHVLNGANFNPGSIHGHQKAGDAVVLGRDVKVGSGEQNDPLGPRCAGGPNFLAVDQIMIALELGLALDSG